MTGMLGGLRELWRGPSRAPAQYQPPPIPAMGERLWRQFPAHLRCPLVWIRCEVVICRLSLGLAVKVDCGVDLGCPQVDFGLLSAVRVGRQLVEVLQPRLSQHAPGLDACRGRHTLRVSNPHSLSRIGKLKETHTLKAGGQGRGCAKQKMRRSTCEAMFGLDLWGRR